MSEGVLDKSSKADGLKTVLLAGGSAGGLATILNSDFVYSILKAGAGAAFTFKSLPISGVFPDAKTV